MSIESEVFRIDYTGQDGTETVFSFPFAIYAESDLCVVRTATDGTSTTLMLTADYTVDVVNKRVTLNSALPEDYGLTIKGQLPLTQKIAFENQGAIFPKSIEEAVDRLTKVAQQLKEELSRAVRLPIQDTATAILPSLPIRKGKLLAFNLGTGALEAGPSSAPLTNLDAALATASAAATAAEAALDSFSDLWLGAKAAEPTADNDGNALQTGALFYHTTAAAVKVWNAEANAWSVAYAPTGNYVSKTGDTMTGALNINVAEGTAPLTVVSSTKVANLNVDKLDGFDWASPPAIGSTAPAPAGLFLDLYSAGQVPAGLAYFLANGKIASHAALLLDAANGILYMPREVRMATGGQTHVGLRGPSTAPELSLIWTLPSADGLAGDALITNGAGALTFGKVAGQTIAVATAPVGIIQTTTETTVFQRTTEANLIGIDKALTAWGMGTIQFGGDDEGNSPVTLRLKYGGTVIASVVLTGATFNSPLPFAVLAKVMGNGNSGAQRGYLELRYGTQSRVMAIGLAAVNSTVAQPLLLTAQWGGTHNGNELTWMRTELLLS